MKTKKVLAFIAAMTLTLGVYSQPVFAEEAVKTEIAVTETAEPKEAAAAEETSGTVSFDEETGTLTLRGNIVKEEVQNYHDKNVVTVIAEEGTFLPEDCYLLFSDFYNVKTIDLSKADTSNITNMCGMFYYCKKVESLNLSNFDTSHVTEMNNMFDNCTSLTSLDLSSFNTSNVTEMWHMFGDCTNLKQLDLRNFDTSKVTNMGGMFSKCKSINSLDLSSFDTSNVTDMENMFYNCSNLRILDISGFDTSNVKTFFNMFAKCGNLDKIRVENFDKSNLKTSDGMFTGCESLVGGDGTAFDAEHTDAEYARVDTLETPGYFTKKSYERATWDNHAEYSLDENGVLTLSGEGAIADFSTKVLQDFGQSNIKSVVVNEGITRLPDYAFLNICNIKSVSLPDTLTEIGKGTFYECSDLEEINIPDSVKMIRSGAFDINAFTEIVIPDSVTTLERKAFHSCRLLRKATIGASVEVLYNDVFYDARSLKELTFMNPGCEIEGGNSYYSLDFTIRGYKGSTAEKYAEENLLNFEAIDSDYKKDYSVDREPPYSGKTEDGIIWEVNPLPDDWTSLRIYGEGKIISAPWLKRNIDKIIDIRISGQITEIGDGVFAGIEFENGIVIPDSVTTIGDHAFETKYSTDITLGSSVSELKKDSIIVKPFINCLTIKNPDCVIEPSDQYEHYLLKIKGYKDSTAEELAKKYNVYFEAIDSDYKKDYSAERELPIGEKNADGIEWEIDKAGIFTIKGEGEVTVPSWKKYKDKIKKVVVSEGITKLPEDAFYECGNLVSVNLPDTLTEIGDSAFGDCTSLTDIIIPDSVTAISNSFYTCTSLETIIIPDSVTELGYHIFDGCSSLKEVRLPANITEIKHNAFTCCASLETITIPDKVTKIGVYAFGACPSLKEITIPASVTEIGDMAFVVAPVKIKGYKGSYAEKYANDNGIEFIALDGSDEFTAICGDANCNGEVELSDAVLIMQSIANPDKYKLTYQGKKNADCSGNGDGVTGKDALAIQKYMLKLVDKLPTE